jgi:hypothetical protein
LRVAAPGCFSWIRIYSIPDSGQKDSRISIRVKEFKYFNPKNCFIADQDLDSSRIRILIFYPSRIQDPGVKKATDPGPVSATMVAIYIFLLFASISRS